MDPMNCLMDSTDARYPITFTAFNAEKWEDTYEFDLLRVGFGTWSGSLLYLSYNRRERRLDNWDVCFLGRVFDRFG